MTRGRCGWLTLQRMKLSFTTLCRFNRRTEKRMKPESVTVKNIEAAFAGESMAHIKYLYFAKIARGAGDVETAKVFEEPAAQEVQHAFGHLDLLYPPREMTPARALEMAIAGETYEDTEMYPHFRHLAAQ